jgi:ribosomal-protein-alanine N-acetyltransferase
MLNLRNYKSKDLPKILEIEIDTFPEPWPKNFFEKLVDTASDLFIIAEDEGQIVGYIIGYLREKRGNKGVTLLGHVLNIAVLEEYRKKGIGTMLMDELEARFILLDATQSFLEVRESNTVAQKFYAKRNYFITGRIKDYYVNEDALIMIKIFGEIPSVI